MKNKLNTLIFYYFEKTQLENYLNDMVKQGYVLVQNKNRFYFVKDSSPDVSYYVEYNMIFNNESSVKELENLGYSYMGDSQKFSIFVSENGQPVPNHLRIDKTDFRQLFWPIINTFLWLLLLVLKLFTYELMNIANRGWLFIIFINFLLVLCSSYTCAIPCIKYCLKKETHYDWPAVLRRDFVNLLFFWLTILAILCLFVKQGILEFIGILIIAVVMFIVSLKWGQMNKPIYLLKRIINVIMIVLCVVEIGFYYAGFRYEQPKLPFQDQVSDIFYSEQSMFLSYTVYEIKDNQRDNITYIESQYSLFQPFILDDLFIHGQYDQKDMKDYTLYTNQEEVIINWGNHFLIVTYDFYQNNFNINALFEK